MYPPLPHPAVWTSVHRQVGLNRVWLHVHNSGCDATIWPQIEKKWPELFLKKSANSYLETLTRMLDAAIAYATPAEFFDSIDRYLLIYQEVHQMGFQVEDEVVTWQCE